MLFDRFNIEEIFKKKSDFRPFPAIDELDIADEIRKTAISNAEKYKGYDWGTLNATLYMRFVRDGNRTAYEDINFARRKALACLAIGEYAENKGRFTDDIINGLWCICEESTWVLPAHNGGHPLPYADKPSVDLFAAQTGAELAFIIYLLREKLDSVSPAICERVEYEIEKRVNEPVLKYNFWWMGFGKDRRDVPSNWTAWCTSTSLACALLTEKDRQKRIDIVNKLLEVLDYYITEYAEDGGCDEGADYWSMSAGCMFDSLELLYRATDGKLDIFDNEKIRNMGDYIRRSHISGEYFINFADCSAKADIGGARTYLFGKRTGADKLMSFGAWDYKNKVDKTLPDSMNMLHKLFSITENVECEKDYESENESTYIESLELLKVKRNNLSLCIKGGHNADNHNHNDVGSYMVYLKNKPVIIDVGVESYSKKTFSSERYTIWTMQSAYHNLPTVNGVMQKDGREYSAKNVKTGDNCFECDISGAYPEEADLKQWIRKAEIDENGIIIEDDFTLNSPTDNVEISVMTHAEPIIGENIVVGEATLSYNGDVWNVKKEKITIEYDAKLTPVWGECVYRLIFSLKNSVSKEKFIMEIKEN